MRTTMTDQERVEILRRYIEAGVRGGWSIAPSLTICTGKGLMKLGATHSSSGVYPNSVTVRHIITDPGLARAVWGAEWESNGRGITKCDYQHHMHEVLQSLINEGEDAALQYIADYMPEVK